MIIHAITKCRFLTSVTHLQDWSSEGRLHWEGRRGSCPLLPHPWGAGGTRIALHTDFIPSLLSSEGAFSGIVDSLVEDTSSDTLKDLLQFG